MYEGDDSNFTGGTPPEESSNRTFIIAAAVLGGIVLLSLACLAIFVVTGFPGTSTAQQ